MDDDIGQAGCVVPFRCHELRATRLAGDPAIAEGLREGRAERVEGGGHERVTRLVILISAAVMARTNAGYNHFNTIANLRGAIKGAVR